MTKRENKDAPTSLMFSHAVRWLLLKTGHVQQIEFYTIEDESTCEWT